MAHPRCAIRINDTIQVSKSFALQAINARNIKSVRYMDQTEAEKLYGTIGKQGVLEFILEKRAEQSQINFRLSLSHFSQS